MQALSLNDSSLKEHALKSAAYLRSVLGPRWMPAAFAGMAGYPTDSGVSSLALSSDVAASLQAISKGDWINIAAVMSVATQLLLHSHVSSDIPLCTGISVSVGDRQPRCLLVLNEAPVAQKKLSELWRMALAHLTTFAATSRWTATRS